MPRKFVEITQQPSINPLKCFHFRAQSTNKKRSLASKFKQLSLVTWTIGQLVKMMIMTLNHCLTYSLTPIMAPDSVVSNPHNFNRVILTFTEPYQEEIFSILVEDKFVITSTISELYPHYFLPLYPNSRTLLPF